ncbi:4'-phosphopantetheinyl transferase family protein [Sediminitomix flava]|uniref:4'-phosphopantetheinyl transferase superfamily protein n=1 Tax=Sediminitomix flava TaxID=379075 RepID=A0A315Z9X5_SEDFL|nr:4'-phosphopantetheinyl transferase superfamily protein [Sediminitomix flava]PWJ42376.1 4'-phosphopantetheinyl transferase superfamily protein [Sediminitomix flava]
MEWVKLCVDKGNLSWGLMRYEIDEQFYIDQLNNRIETEVLSRKNKKSRIESLAARFALKNLLQELQLGYEGIVKDENQKPFLKNIEGQIAISHTSKYVAVAFHQTDSIGIDIEKWSERLLRVVPRIMSNEEQKSLSITNDNALKLWCAKEALYKLNGKKNIDFTNEIKILETHESSWTAQIPQSSDKIPVEFELIHDICLAKATV